MAIQMASGRRIEENDGEDMQHVVQYDEQGQPVRDESGKAVIVATPIVPNIAAQVLAGDVSAAKRRLNRLREGKLASGEKLVEPVEIDGETIFIKRLNWSELTRVHLMSGRDKSGHLDVSSGDDELKNMLTGGLLVAVFCDELAETPYFSNISEAIELAEATDMETVGFVSVLFNEIAARNPGLKPTLILGARIAETLRSEPSAPSAASTTSTSTIGTTGSNETDSTELPSESPDNSEVNDSESTGEATPPQ
jgi:hypothetical protein